MTRANAQDITFELSLSTATIKLFDLELVKTMCSFSLRPFFHHFHERIEFTVGEGSWQIYDFSRVLQNDDSFLIQTK